MGSSDTTSSETFEIVVKDAGCNETTGAQLDVSQSDGSRGQVVAERTPPGESEGVQQRSTAIAETPTTRLRADANRRHLTFRSIAPVTGIDVTVSVLLRFCWGFTR